MFPYKTVWGIQFTMELIECFNLVKMNLSCSTCSIHCPKQDPGLPLHSFSDSDSFGCPDKYFKERSPMLIAFYFSTKQIYQLLVVEDRE